MNFQQQKTSVLIIGAGLCGLSGAYHLGQAGCMDYLVLEHSHEVGGLCRTQDCGGFSFDYSIHILYTHNPYAADLICNKLLTGNLRKQARASFCYTAGVYTEYPYQANNYGLPIEVIEKNIMGLIEARYEMPQDGFPPHFEAWLYRTFGGGIAEHFMLPYNRRQWAWDLKEMAYSWIAERVPMPKIQDVLLGALKPPAKKYGPNHEFWYPIEGGIEALPRAFLKYIPKEHIWLNTEVVAVDASRHELVLKDNRRIRYDWLISTMPLPALISLLGKSISSKVKACAGRLKHNIVHTVNIGLEGTSLGVDMPMHWVYFPDENTIFHRLNFPNHFSATMVPPGCCSIQAEISESVYRPRNRTTLVEETLQGLARAGILGEREICRSSEGGRVCLTQVVTLDPAYVIYDLQHGENMQIIKDYLKSLQIESRGRFGEWEYFNMDHSILSGQRAVEHIMRGRASVSGSSE